MKTTAIRIDYMGILASCGLSESEIKVAYFGYGVLGRLSWDGFGAAYKFTTGMVSMQRWSYLSGYRLIEVLSAYLMMCNIIQHKHKVHKSNIEFEVSLARNFKRRGY